MNHVHTLEIGGLTHLKSLVMFENYSFHLQMQRWQCSCLQEVSYWLVLMHSLTEDLRSQLRVCVCVSERKVYFTTIWLDLFWFVLGRKVLFHLVCYLHANTCCGGGWVGVGSQLAQPCVCVSDKRPTSKPWRGEAVIGMQKEKGGGIEGCGTGGEKRNV